MEPNVGPWRLQEPRQKRRKLSAGDNDHGSMLNNFISMFTHKKINTLPNKEISWEHDPHRYDKLKTGRIDDKINVKELIHDNDFNNERTSRWILLKNETLDDEKIRNMFDEVGFIPGVGVIVANRAFIQEQYAKDQYYNLVTYIYFDFEETVTLEPRTCEDINYIINLCSEIGDLIIRTNVCIVDYLDLGIREEGNIILQSPYRNEGMNLIDEFNKSSFITRENILLNETLFVGDNTGKRNMFEKFVRDKTGNFVDSIDKIMYNLGGKYL